MSPVLGVVVPARDEEDELDGCLEAVSRASRWVGAAAEVRVVVVLDGCRDRTAAVAARHGVRTRTVSARGVGEARDLGCRALLADPGPPVGWLACTDADSRVPPDWLLAHLDAAAEGYDAWVGTVYVADWLDHPHPARRRFRDAYDIAADPHPHVHGANLGVRAAAYRSVGGFPPVAAGEDHALLAGLERADHPVLRSRRCPVLTSARRRARADDGFARRLHTLADPTTAAAQVPSMLVDDRLGDRGKS